MSADEDIKFKENIRQTLEITQENLRSAGVVPKERNTSFDAAKQIIQELEPIPWFVWRLSNYVLGKSGRPIKAGQGLVLGLNKLLLAAAADRVLGTADPIKTAREAHKVLRSDVIVAASIIQAVSKRLKTKNNELLWSPLLEEALTRAHVGFFVGQLNSDFSPGRGMLAGFASKVGFIILLASGGQHDAEKALGLVQEGQSMRAVCLKIYRTDPMQVSALLLSACGCGKDSSFGTMAYGSYQAAEIVTNNGTYEQQQWLAAYVLIEAAITKQLQGVDELYWKALSFGEQSDRDELAELVNIMLAKGHGWEWMS